jgi:hypothetical protein
LGKRRGWKIERLEREKVDGSEGEVKSEVGSGIRETTGLFQPCGAFTSLTAAAVQ